MGTILYLYFSLVQSKCLWLKCEHEDIHTHIHIQIGRGFRKKSDHYYLNEYYYCCCSRWYQCFWS